MQRLKSLWLVLPLLVLLGLGVLLGTATAAGEDEGKPLVRAKIPAFPAAEGAGAWTPGGRGGKVCVVTNLNDKRPGSLKKYGLDPNDPSDAIKDKNGDGYTNIEKYLNGLDPTKLVDYTKPENNKNVFHKKS